MTYVIKHIKSGKFFCGYDEELGPIWSHREEDSILYFSYINAESDKDLLENELARKNESLSNFKCVIVTAEK